MTSIGVLQMTDTLEMGGAERVALNLANQLPRDRFRSYLCTTRREGPLAEQALPDVGRLCLERNWTFDPAALRRLVRFIRQERIQVLHPHGTALLVANLAACCPPYPRIVWHDHYGPNAQQERPVWMYKLLTRRVGAVLAVSESLADWARLRLRLPAERVHYLPNFALPGGAELHGELPGAPGQRVVCVANLRPVKDQVTLVRAFQLLAAEFSAAQLLLVGDQRDAAYVAQIRDAIREARLEDRVQLLGPRTDVSAILAHCDVGVLSSRQEALPMSLLEYGLAGLPVVITNVGQCAAVVGGDDPSVVVPPGDAAALARALRSLLASAEARRSRGAALQGRIRENYSAQAVIERLADVYQRVLTN